jgi:hypothetical protein
VRIRRSRVSRAPAYPAMYPCHVSRTAATYRIPRIRVSRVSAYPAYPRIRVSLPRIPYCRHVSRHVSHCAGVAKLRKTERRSLLLACRPALPHCPQLLAVALPADTGASGGGRWEGLGRVGW